MAYQPKSYRKFLATSLTAALVVPAVAVGATPASAANNFSDVDPNLHGWAIDAIDYLVDKGAIEGKPGNIFDVHGNLTRAEAAAILARTFDLSVSDNQKTDFADARDHWGSKYIAAIQRQLPGVINGYNGKFNPNDNITRQELAKMVVEAYDDLELVEGIDVNFPDNNGWGAEYVEILASNGIVEGLPSGNFGVNQDVTRGQAAVFFHRTEVPEERLIQELAVSDVKALDATTVQVEFNDGNAQNYTVDTLEIGEPTEIEVEYKGETFKVTVTYDPNQVAAPGTVAFDNQPAAKSLPFGSQLNEVYNFQITAGEDAITLRSVQLKQYGTARASEADVSNVHLSVNGEIRATGSISANGEVRLTRSVTIPANSTVEFQVLADIPAEDAQATATVQFGIESINAFTANAALNGSFPNVGNAHSIVAGNIGTVTVTPTTHPADAAKTNYTVETGDVQEEIGKFSLQAGSEEGVKVNRITLTANGFNADDFENIYLYDNNGKDKIEAEGIASRNEVVFDLSDADIEIGRNQSKSFVLKADPIAAGANGTTGDFEIAESYHLVTQGLNTGYNNGNTVDNGKTLGNVKVNIGDPKFRVSPNTPKSGDKIVASTSEYGVVREYTLNPAGQEVTLKDAKVTVAFGTITVDGNNPTELEKAIRSIELYDANTGSVIKTLDIEDGKPVVEGEGDGAVTVGLTFDAKGLNWYVDKSMNLQLRAVATADNVNVKDFDAFITDLDYEIQLANGKKENKSLRGPVQVAQSKEFTTQGDTEIQKPGSSAQIAGYSISGGLSNALLGNFRVEAKEEAVEVSDAKIKIDGVNDIEKHFSNPTLVHDGEVVAHGDINGDEIEFDFVDDFVVETGSSERKVLEFRADVLENSIAGQFTPVLTELETRGVNSNIVSNANLSSGYDGKLTTSALDYRATTVAITVSEEAIDTTATTNTRVLKFTVENLSPNNPADKSKVAKIKQFGFENLFAFPADAEGEKLFELRDKDAKSEDFVGTVDGKTVLLVGDSIGGTPEQAGEFAVYSNGDSTNNITVTAKEKSDDLNNYVISLEQVADGEEAAVVIDSESNPKTITIKLDLDDHAGVNLNELAGAESPFNFAINGNLSALADDELDFELTTEGEDYVAEVPAGQVDAFEIKGDDDEELFLYADLATRKLDNDPTADSIFKNVRMRLDAKQGLFKVYENDGTTEIRPLIINEGKGPDITIRD